MRWLVCASQAVGFAILVVGTLVYDRGDQKVAAEMALAAAATADSGAPNGGSGEVTTSVVCLFVQDSS